MFRLHAVRSNLRYLQRQFAHDKVLKTTLATSVGLSYMHYSINQASCDFVQVVPEVPKVVEIIESKIEVIKNEIESAGYFTSMWNSLVSQAGTALKNIGKAVQYMERIFTYMLFGAPLVGLVPANYFLGTRVPELENMTWGYLVWALQQLGPCFVKMAQWASTRPDIFPPNLIARLEALQDDVKVFHPFSTVEKTLSEAFGDDWQDKLIIEPKPVGTGSVAQVFKGFLKKFNEKTQTEEKVQVAVKMIHPHVEKLIRVDMELFNHFANCLDYFPSLEILSLGESCREFSEVMNVQLDLRKEASHLVKFTKKFMNEKWAVFPAPVEGWVTKNVILETLMEGTPISYYMKLSDDLSEKTKKLKMKLSDLGCRLIIKMIFFDNFIHGDLHPGNLLVQIMPNGEPRLVVLDCGIVYASKSEAEHEKLVDICIAFMKHDGLGAGRLMVENAVAKQQEVQSLHHTSDGKAIVPGSREEKILAEKVHNADEFCKGIQQLVDDSEQESYFEHIGEYLSKICELARVHSVRLDTGYFKIAMALKVAEGISLALDRDLQLVTKCIPIITKAKAMRALGMMKFPEPEPDDEFMKEDANAHHGKK